MLKSTFSKNWSFLAFCPCLLVLPLKAEKQKKKIEKKKGFRKHTNLKLYSLFLPVKGIRNSATFFTFNCFLHLLQHIKSEISSDIYPKQINATTFYYVGC